MTSFRILGACALAAALSALIGCGGGGGGGSVSSSGSGGSSNSASAGTGDNGINAGSLPVYVLIGGASKPSGSSNDIRLDPALDSGEMFMMTKTPLESGAVYHVTVELTSGGSTFTHDW